MKMETAIASKLDTIAVIDDGESRNIEVFVEQSLEQLLNFQKTTAKKIEQLKEQSDKILPTVADHMKKMQNDFDSRMTNLTLELQKKFTSN